MSKNLNIYEITTSAWNEENFHILTDLTPSQIKKVLKPIIKAEADADDITDNETLVEILQKKYPKNVVVFYDSFEMIEIF